MSDDLDVAIGVEYARQKKIAHLTEVALDCFSILDPPTGREIEIIEAIAKMVVHASSRSDDKCCAPFERSTVQSANCLRCLDVHWLKFTTEDGWHDACPNCNEDGKKEPGEEE